MMKKILIVTVLITTLIIILFCSIYLKRDKDIIKDFNTKDFQEMINEFSYVDHFGHERYLGYIGSSDEAKSFAEEIWLEIFGKEVLNEKPYIVSFDKANQIWLVEGTFENQFFSKGGVAYILIQKNDGRIIAVWHDE